MVYGARLESVCTGNRTVGSNPTFTASRLIHNPAKSRDSYTQVRKKLCCYSGLRGFFFASRGVSWPAGGPLESNAASEIVGIK